jgi:membrane protease YdiL (CAAX protease family)
MKSFMKQRPLVSYFVLAYGLSWLIWVPLAVVATRLAEPPEWLNFLFIPGIYGASGAGFIMTRVVEGKPGVKKLWARYRMWRVGFQWWLVVLLTMPVVTAAALGIYALQGNPLGQFEPGRLPLLLAGSLFALIMGPLGEEGGWRGFALSRMQDKYGAFWSSLVLGILHWAWHAPLFWFPVGTTISGEPVTLARAAIFLGMVTAGTFVYTWVFNHTGGSMLMMVLLHLSFNVGDGYVLGMFPDISPDAYFHIGSELGNITAWALVVLLLVLFGPARLSRKPVPQGQEPEVV